jgi:hypothetical protein
MAPTASERFSITLDNCQSNSKVGRRSCSCPHSAEVPVEKMLVIVLRIIIPDSVSADLHW